jgi:peptidyl-prolyl cis-trans isomerase SDCCAG10
MAELYITEPPTTGKVILETNYGNIDIELFTLEAPKSCRNFIQHCLNKYYNGCHFFKIFKNFMIQTGDPTNTGSGGVSIYSEDFRDEFHSRLRFNHRGVVAMNNKNKPNSNGSQFFITLEKCEEMNKKFTIFGKVTGPTFFNAVNISNLSADEDGIPLMNNKDEIPKIINTEVVINPFKDLKPTVDISQFEKNKNIDNEENNTNKKKKKKLKIKNITDKMFFNIDDEEENEKDKIEEKNEIKEDKENNDKKNEEQENKKEKVIDIEEKEENNSSKSEESESESKSLSSDNNEVQHAKQVLENEEPEKINKRKNIDDYKKEINLLRQKIKREKEEIYNEEEFKKKVEKEKISQMNILQKFKYDYVNSNEVNKLSNDERKNKLKNFKNYIGGKDQDKWYKTKLKFQTDSQKAFTLDMINKELEKNG